MVNLTCWRCSSICRHTSKVKIVHNKLLKPSTQKTNSATKNTSCKAPITIYLKTCHICHLCWLSAVVCDVSSGSSVKRTPWWGITFFQISAPSKKASARLDTISVFHICVQSVSSHRVYPHLCLRLLVSTSHERRWSLLESTRRESRSWGWSTNASLFLRCSSTHQTSASRRWASQRLSSTPSRPCQKVREQAALPSEEIWFNSFMFLLTPSSQAH